MKAFSELNYYSCRICKERKPDFISLLNHRRSVHNINIIYKTIKHVNLEPDVYDPNRYCRACEKTFGLRKNYLQHLRGIHDMVLPLLKGRPKASIIPDPYDVSHNCCSCNKAYGSQQNYRRHLKSVHKMTLNPIDLKKKR